MSEALSYAHVSTKEERRKLQKQSKTYCLMYLSAERLRNMDPSFHIVHLLEGGSCKHGANACDPLVAVTRRTRTLV